MSTSSIGFKRRNAGGAVLARLTWAAPVGPRYRHIDAPPALEVTQSLRTIGGSGRRQQNRLRRVVRQGHQSVSRSTFVHFQQDNLFSI
jgi:hypothetical protein